MASPKYGVYIGRFQPVHLGHQCVINEIYHMGLEPVICIGSAQESRTEKNPLNYCERYELIKTIYPKINVNELRDYPDNDDLWFTQVLVLVDYLYCFIRGLPEDSFVLVGHKKIQDRRTYTINDKEYHNKHYLDIFEEVFNIPVIEANYHNMLGIDISATDIRNDLEGNRHYLDYRVYNKLKEVYSEEDRCQS